jgi:crotonobetainyl-CoA:carnitine CoA-transferase CaiB-like acyl-CoA transferase
MTAPERRAATLLDEGIVVAEIGERVAAGACGSLLAQLGATVIAPEPRQRRSDGKWRHRAAMLAGKRTFAFDPERADDAALHAALVEAADVVIVSTDYPRTDETLWRRSRPSTQIVCDITAFGHDAPLSGTGGHEALVQAMGGIVETTGPADAPPAIVGTSVLEMSTAVFAASAILAALRVRRLHGFGQRIDMALYDTAVNELVNFLPLYFVGGQATRSGNRHPLHVPWGSYRARDGHVLVCSVTGDQFTRICQAIGRPDLAEDERFKTSAARLANFRALDASIGEWTGARTVAECERVLSELGIACGPIVPVDALRSEANLAHRDSVRDLDDPLTRSRAAVPASPIRGRPVTGRHAERIPRVDEDRRDIAALLADRHSRGTAVTGDVHRDTKALAGVRIVEIGQYTVAPLASRQLGALGADVVKIEPPSGDAIRHSSPLRDDGLSYIFALSNTDKRGLVLDLREPRDRARLHRLLDNADALVENLRPGALAKLGFSSETLRERHPHLVYCSINGFGNDSAYPGRPALDTVIQAMSGLMATTRVGGEPMKAGISASDVLGGEFGLLSVLAGLEHRERSGVAPHFDISMQDASSWMTQLDWPGALPAEPTSVVEAADGCVVVEGDAARSAAAVKSLANPDRAAVVAALSKAGLAAAPVLRVAEVLGHPQCIARRLLVECGTSDGDRWTVVASPLRLLSTPAVVRSVMARLGSEDAAVIAEFDLDASAQCA